MSQRVRPLAGPMINSAISGIASPASRCAHAGYEMTRHLPSAPSPIPAFASGTFAASLLVRAIAAPMTAISGMNRRSIHSDQSGQDDRLAGVFMLALQLVIGIGITLLFPMLIYYGVATVRRPP